MQNIEKSLDIEKSLELCKLFFETIKPRIDAAIEKNTTAPATLLAKEICGQFDMEWSTAYNLIKMCVSANDHLEIKLGPKGGVALKKEYWNKTDTASNISEGTDSVIIIEQ